MRADGGGNQFVGRKNTGFIKSDSLILIHQLQTEEAKLGHFVRIIDWERFEELFYVDI